MVYIRRNKNKSCYRLLLLDGCKPAPHTSWHTAAIISFTWHDFPGIFYPSRHIRTSCPSLIRYDSKSPRLVCSQTDEFVNDFNILSTCPSKLHDSNLPHKISTTYGYGYGHGGRRTPTALPIINPSPRVLAYVYITSFYTHIIYGISRSFIQICRQHHRWHPKQYYLHTTLPTTDCAQKNGLIIKRRWITKLVIGMRDIKAHHGSLPG